MDIIPLFQLINLYHKDEDSYVQNTGQNLQGLSLDETMRRKWDTDHIIGDLKAENPSVDRKDIAIRLFEVIYPSLPSVPDINFIAIFESLKKINTNALGESLYGKILSQPSQTSNIRKGVTLYSHPTGNLFPFLLVFKN